MAGVFWSWLRCLLLAGLSHDTRVTAHQEKVLADHSPLKLQIAPTGIDVSDQATVMSHVCTQWAICPRVCRKTRSWDIQLPCKDFSCFLMGTKILLCL